VQDVDPHLNFFPARMEMGKSEREMAFVFSCSHSPCAQTRYYISTVVITSRDGSPQVNEDFVLFVLLTKSKTNSAAF
jgi:hypothetical protein